MNKTSKELPEIFIWSVEKFSSITKRSVSKDFETLHLGNDAKLRLILYSNGDSEKSKPYTQINALLSTKSEEAQENIEVKCRLSLLNCHKKQCCLQDGMVKLSDNRNMYWCQLTVWKDFLLDAKNEMLPDGNLVIYCELFPKLFVNFVECEKHFVDFSNLLEMGHLSDVTLVIGKKKKYSVHKCILAARSPVFEAMFASDLKEKNTNLVQIDDMSEEVCETLLKYMYTGRLPPMEQCVDELFIASDKYQLNIVKSVCERYMSSNLEIDSVACVLTLADMHGASELRAKCIELITNNSAAVILTEGWKQLIKSRPDLLAELYQELANSKKYKVFL